MLAFSIPNHFCPSIRWCLVLVCSFLPSALAAAGGEPVFGHRSQAWEQDDRGFQFIAAEFKADIRQIDSLLRPSPDADVGIGAGSAWLEVPDETKGAEHGLTPQPTPQTPPTPQVPKPTGAGKPETKISVVKDGVKEEELLTSLYLWFGVGSLLIPCVVCCCVPVIDPENMTFNLFVDLAIVASSIFIGLDLVRPDMEDQFTIVHYCFTAFFLGELAVRIRALGPSFFAEFWGIFDFTLVFAAVIDFWVLPIVSLFIENSFLARLAQYPWLPNLLRTLRLLRLLRLIRLFRPTSTLMQHKDDSYYHLDDLDEVWVMIPKEGGKTGKRRGRKKTMDGTLSSVASGV